MHAVVTLVLLVSSLGLVPDLDAERSFRSAPGSWVIPDVPRTLDGGVADERILGWFAALVEEGGWGTRDSEQAAFLVGERDGTFRCVLWPHTHDRRSHSYRGGMPAQTIAIVHTHPHDTPRPSRADRDQARRLGIPIFVVTPRNIFEATPEGEVIAVVDRTLWATETPAMSCSG